MKNNTILHSVFKLLKNFVHTLYLLRVCWKELQRSLYQHLGSSLIYFKASSREVTLKAPFKYSKYSERCISVANMGSHSLNTAKKSWNTIVSGNVQFILENKSPDGFRLIKARHSRLRYVYTDLSIWVENSAVMIERASSSASPTFRSRYLCATLWETQYTFRWSECFNTCHYSYFTKLYKSPNRIGRTARPSKQRPLLCCLETKLNSSLPTSIRSSPFPKWLEFKFLPRKRNWYFFASFLHKLQVERLLLHSSVFEKTSELNSIRALLH